MSTTPDRRTLGGLGAMRRSSGPATFWAEGPGECGEGVATTSLFSDSEAFLRTGVFTRYLNAVSHKGSADLSLRGNLLRQRSRSGMLKYKAMSIRRTCIKKSTLNVNSSRMSVDKISSYR